jgi:hypothetical protein
MGMANHKHLEGFVWVKEEVGLRVGWSGVDREEKEVGVMGRHSFPFLIKENSDTKKESQTRQQELDDNNKKIGLTALQLEDEDHLV